MTRRITLTMVAMVAGALLVAGLGTLLVFRLEAGDQARRDLGRQAERLAAEVEALEAPGAFGPVARALRLEGQAVVRVGPDGRVRGPVPSGLTVADLDPEGLRADRTVTGVRGSLAFAAAPARRGDAVLAVVVTRQVGTGRPTPGPWFLVAVLGTLAVAAAVAVRLGRRLTRPLRAAEEATRRIAGGDLAVRVPEPEGDEELARLARSVNALAAGLERSRGLERQFLLSVSHDLRTPLTSIRGFAEALSEGRATDPASAATIIAAEARRLERLVGDLLELAKLDARRFSLDIRGVDVAEVVSDTAEGFRPAADRAGVALTLETWGSSVVAAADPDRLAQVMANLIENALKFAANEIRVGGGRGDDGSVSVWVDDDGPGIGAADLPHVFEPFYRAGRDPTRQVGSGLGLAIVAELVGAMGGTVQALPGPQGGTRVLVVLRPWQLATV